MQSAKRNKQTSLSIPSLSEAIIERGFAYDTELQQSPETLFKIIKILSKYKKHRIIRTIIENKPELNLHREEIALYLFTNPKDSYSSSEPLELELLHILFPSKLPLSPDQMPAKQLFHGLISKYNYVAIKFFLDNAMLKHYSDMELQDLLFDLAENGRVNLANQLIEQRPSLNKNYECKHGNSFLHYAFSSEHSDWELITKLLRNNQKGLMEENDTKETPLTTQSCRVDLLVKACQEPEIIKTLPLEQLIKIIMKLSECGKQHIIPIILEQKPELKNNLEDIAFYLLTEPKHSYHSGESLELDLLNILFPSKKPLSPTKMPAKEFFLALISKQNNVAIKFFLDNGMFQHYSNEELGVLLLELLAKRYQVDLANQLLEQRPDIHKNYKNELGNNVLHYALSSPHVWFYCDKRPDWNFISKLLLNNPDGLMELNRDKKTPLLSAMRHCRFGLIQTRDSRFDIITKVCEETDILKKLPIEQLGKMLSQISKGQQYHLIKLFLEKRPELQCYVEQIAIRHLQNNPFDTRLYVSLFPNHIPFSPAHLSIQTLTDIIIQDTETFTYLVEAPMLKQYSNNEVGNLLLKFIHANKIDLAIKLLQQRPDIDKTLGDIDLNTALHLCMMLPTPDKQLALKLTENNPASAAINRNDHTPLFIAAQRHHYGVMALLIQKTDIIQQYSIQQLIEVANVLQQHARNDLVDQISTRNPLLREAVQTKKLFELKNITTESKISREQIKSALLNINPKDITAEHSIIFLKHYLELPPKKKTIAAQLFHKPELAVNHAVIRKLLDHLVDHKPLNISPFDIKVLMGYHSLSSKIIDKFISIKELSELKDAIDDNKGFHFMKKTG